VLERLPLLQRVEHQESTRHTVTVKLARSMKEDRTYAVVEIVAVPVPSLQEFDLVALILGPGVAIRQWSVKGEYDDTQSQEDNSTCLSDDRLVANTKGANAGSQKVVDLAKCDDGEVESWEVVVQEELSLHEEEREIVERPSKYSRTDLVVEAPEGDVVVVTAGSLPSQDGESLEHDIEGDCSSRAQPDQRVTNEVDLEVVLAPEVDTTAKDWP